MSLDDEVVISGLIMTEYTFHNVISVIKLNLFYYLKRKMQGSNTFWVNVISNKAYIKQFL